LLGQLRSIEEDRASRELKDRLTSETPPPARWRMKHPPGVRCRLSLCRPAAPRVSSQTKNIRGIRGCAMAHRVPGSSQKANADSTESELSIGHVHIPAVHSRLIASFPSAFKGAGRAKGAKECKAYHGGRHRVWPARAPRPSKGGDAGWIVACIGGRAAPALRASRHPHLVEAPADQEYGDRRCGIEDLKGHPWYFAQPLQG